MYVVFVVYLQGCCERHGAYNYVCVRRTGAVAAVSVVLWCKRHGAHYVCVRTGTVAAVSVVSWCKDMGRCHSVCCLVVYFQGCCERHDTCSYVCVRRTGTVSVVYVVVQGQGLLLLLQCNLSCGVLAGQTMEGSIEVKKNRKDPRSLDISITLDGKSHDYFMD